MPGVFEARQIAKLGQERDRPDHIDTAHGLLQPLDPFPDLSYSQQHFLEGNALLAVLKLEAGEPVDVRPPPGFLARIVTAETQQKRGDVLALDSVVLDRGIVARTRSRIAS